MKINFHNPKYLTYASFITLVLVFAFVLYLLWPRTFLKILQYEVYDDVNGMKLYSIKAGDSIEYEINFEKYMNVSVEVTTLLKQVNNGYLYPLDEGRTTRMPVGKHHYKNNMTIPRATPNGRYVIIRTYRAFISPLKEETLSVTSNEFDVLGKAPELLKEIEKGNVLSQQNQAILKEVKKQKEKSWKN